ncbi:hypothetical protein NSQ41_12755 [Aeribacillus sp. FSL K6-8210]|uniref:hypothetical protein n=1 Tax=Aeribacillus sp. FSL K6-8210 TaxID=2954683 RepID=UPI0030D362CB
MEIKQWEFRHAILNQNEECLTVAHFIREKNSNNDWEYAGTVSYYSDGDIQLDDKPD